MNERLLDPANAMQPIPRHKPRIEYNPHLSPSDQELCETLWQSLCRQSEAKSIREATDYAQP